jgi:hypothetical protein
LSIREALKLIRPKKPKPERTETVAKAGPANPILAAWTNAPEKRGEALVAIGLDALLKAMPPELVRAIIDRVQKQSKRAHPNRKIYPLETIAESRPPTEPMH